MSTVLCQSESALVLLGPPSANRALSGHAGAHLPQVHPHFTMFWRENIPSGEFDEGRVSVTTVAGTLSGLAKPPSPPPDSWASDDSNHVAIWAITLQPGGSWTLPAAPQVWQFGQCRPLTVGALLAPRALHAGRQPLSVRRALPCCTQGVNRSLYFFKGSSVEVGGQQLGSHANMTMEPTQEAPLKNVGKDVVELLMLQGKPIDESVAQQGPFVMNTQQELLQAFMDYRSGKFGGWPWPTEDPVADREEKRFAKYEDGRVERPTDA